MDNQIQIQYYLDNESKISSISFSLNNTVNALKDIVSISTGLSHRDFDIHLNKKKLDEHHRIIDVIKNTYNIPKFHIKSKQSKLSRRSNPLFKSLNKYYENPYEDVNYQFKKSNKYLYQKKEKSFAGYPYCLLIDNVLYPEIIYEILEKFHENKKIPRMFKNLENGNSLEFFFKQQSVAEDFKIYLDKEVKSTKDLKHIYLHSVIKQDEDLFSSMKSNIYSHAQMPTLPEIKQIPKSPERELALKDLNSPRSNLNISINEEIDNHNAKRLVTEVNQNVMKVNSILRKGMSPLKQSVKINKSHSKIRTIVNKLYGNKEQETRSLNIMLPFNDRQHPSLEEIAIERSHWLCNQDFGKKNGIIRPPIIPNYVYVSPGQDVHYHKFREVEKRHWVIPDKDFLCYKQNFS